MPHGLSGAVVADGSPGVVMEVRQFLWSGRTKQGHDREGRGQERAEKREKEKRKKTFKSFSKLIGQSMLVLS